MEGIVPPLAFVGMKESLRLSLCTKNVPYTHRAGPVGTLNPLNATPCVQGLLWSWAPGPIPFWERKTEMNKLQAPRSNEQVKQRDRREKTEETALVGTSKPGLYAWIEMCTRTTFYPAKSWQTKKEKIHKHLVQLSTNHNYYNYF